MKLYECFIKNFTIIMRIVGILDKYTAEVFKLLGVETIVLSVEDSNLSSKVIDNLNEFKKDKNIFSVLVSKNISSKIRKDLEEFILNNSKPTIVEIDPMYNIEKYENYENIIKRIIRETIGIKL